MPRRSDPVVAVVNYFETAPIEAALVTLAVAKEIVARREGKPAPQVRFQNYPVLTTSAVTAIATWVALASQHFVFALHSWTQIVGTFVTILLVSALTYNHVVANSPTLKSAEAPKEGTVPAR